MSQTSRQTRNLKMRMTVTEICVGHNGAERAKVIRVEMGSGKA